MTPLPKRKHTHSRTGMRKNSAANALKLPSLTACPKCKKLKTSHQTCLYCGEYK